MRRKPKKPSPCVFSAYRTLPDGTRIYAKDYGLKVFPICTAQKPK